MTDNQLARKLLEHVQRRIAALDDDYDQWIEIHFDLLRYLCEAA